MLPDKELMKKYATVSLIVFLRNECVEDKFIKACQNTIDEHSLGKFLDEAPYNCLELPFVWENTEEGYEFWKQLSNKYNNIMEH